MPGTLTNSPADVLRQLLISRGLTQAASSSTWPTYAYNEPDSPDNCVTLYNTAGRKAGRHQISGEVQEFHGIQIRIRSANPDTGYNKARAIQKDLDESVYQNQVTVAGSTAYLVHAVHRTGDVNSLGREEPTSGRYLFTVNVLAEIREAS